jgi:hypothetical protein
MQAVTFYKDGKAVDREELLRLEVRRARQMMSLMFRKLGTDGMAKLFAAEIEQADQLEHSWSESSGNGFRASVATARISEGSAAEFVQWFVAGYMGPNVPAMLRAHPEHLGAMQLPDGRVGVFEVPGHTELPAMLHLHRLESWPEDVPIELDPDMPVRIMGRGEAKNGRVHGYLLHQFRDTSPGFEAKLAIYWRDGAPDELVDGHADHLMLEFNNWLQAYVRTRTQPSELMPVMLSINA